jgi:hypothetical protein
MKSNLIIGLIAGFAFGLLVGLSHHQADRVESVAFYEDGKIVICQNGYRAFPPRKDGMCHTEDGEQVRP